MTAKILSNMKSSFEDASELDGFEDLKKEDQERVTKAFESGKVADEDIPDSARKPDGAAADDDEEDDEEKPKKKRAPAKKKDADAEEKPKRARAPKVSTILKLLSQNDDVPDRIFPPPCYRKPQKRRTKMAKRKRSPRGNPEPRYVPWFLASSLYDMYLSTEGCHRR